MALLPETQEILNLVQERSGVPIEVLPDAQLQVYAKITVAKPGWPAHILRVKPSNQPADYVIAFECGFILRLLQNPPESRFDLAGKEEAKRNLSTILTRPNSPILKLGLPLQAIPQFADQLYSGLLTQIRSMPIGMRIDSWIQQHYAGLRELQEASIAEQQRTNLRALDPKMRSMAPKKVYDANVTMNAAYALFFEREFNQSGFSLAYRTSGFERGGNLLLDKFDSINDDPLHDCELVDTWAHELKVRDWYQWVPHNL